MFSDILIQNDLNSLLVEAIDRRTLKLIQVSNIWVMYLITLLISRAGRTAYFLILALDLSYPSQFSSPSVTQLLPFTHRTGKDGISKHNKY